MQYCILDSSEMEEKEERWPPIVHVLYKDSSGIFYLDQGEKPRRSHSSPAGINLGINIAYTYNYIMKLGLTEIKDDEMPPLLLKALDGQNTGREKHIAVFLKSEEKNTS